MQPVKTKPEILHNRKGRQQLLADLAREAAPRRIASFYRYLTITDPQTFRDELYRTWQSLGVLGRIYVAHEGINAQFSVPEPRWQEFVDSLSRWPATRDIFINVSPHYFEQPFLKLKIKVRRYIVTDGLQENLLLNTPPAQHLTPMDFHQAVSDPQTLVVDVRNQYECETGRFKGAWLPKSETFAAVLPELETSLADQKDRRLLLYCTGGIRCEKASAYLQQKGFHNVYQLQGGVINYLNKIQEAGLAPNFEGSLFVFDGRMAEPTVGQPIGHCYQCQAAYDVHSDCANVKCHRLMIQCPTCRQRLQGCCSEACLNDQSSS